MLSTLSRGRGRQSRNVSWSRRIREGEGAKQQFQSLDPTNVAREKMKPLLEASLRKIHTGLQKAAQVEVFQYMLVSIFRGEHLLAS